MAQFGGELARNHRGFVVVALGAVDHQLAAPKLRAGNGVGAEILGDDECKSQAALAHPVPGLFGVVQIHITKAVAGAQFGNYLPAHVEYMVAVFHPFIQVHQRHRQ